MMEQRVAQAVRCMGEDDFDLFGASDRAALMELVTDYFCGDEQDFEELSSGMRAPTPPQAELMYIHKPRHRRGG